MKHFDTKTITVEIEIQNPTFPVTNEKSAFDSRVVVTYFRLALQFAV